MKAEAEESKRYSVILCMRNMSAYDGDSNEKLSNLIHYAAANIEHENDS